MNLTESVSFQAAMISPARHWRMSPRPDQAESFMEIVHMYTYIYMILYDYYFIKLEHIDKIGA